MSTTISGDLSHTDQHPNDQSTLTVNYNTISASTSTNNTKTVVRPTVAQVTNDAVTNKVAAPQLAQWVYIQTPSKVGLPITTTNKPNCNNVFVNSVPQLQISNLPTNLTNKNINIPHNISLPSNITIPNNQSVIFTHPGNNTVKQHLVIQKNMVGVQAMPVVPVSVASSTVPKNTLAYLTMIKPSMKSMEQTNRMQIAPLAPLTKLKTGENMQILVSNSVSSYSLNSQSNHKYVIAPMPKITTNRLPATATTNSVQSKIAFMPLSFANNVPPSGSSNKNKIFNLKIADGQVQSDNSSGITVMCDNSKRDGVDCENKVVASASNKDKGKLICTEVINYDFPAKKCGVVIDKTYELSITENCNSKNDVSYTISIPDETDRSKTLGDNKYPAQKDAPKLSKHHGVSILKKSLGHMERTSEKPQTSLIISSIPNSITTISDSNTKEVKITTSTNVSTDDEIIVSEKRIIPQRSVRRRKSNFSLRKDYDELIVSTNANWEAKKLMAMEKYADLDCSDITLTKLDEDDEVYKKPPEKAMEDIVEIEVIKEKQDINMNDAYNVEKLLTWEDGVGSLPGSDLKFKLNEFGVLELMIPEERKELQVSKKPKSKHTKDKADDQEEMRCVECGCYGMPSEFISPKYCSNDCQEAGNKAAKKQEARMRRKNYKMLLKKKTKNDFIPRAHAEPSTEKGSNLSDTENTSNENSQDKFNYPWNCSKKGFSWARYLDHIKAKAAPVKLFKDPFPYTRNGFRPGMKLEGVDPQHTSYFCVLTVAEVLGYRLRLHFDGYPDNYDFWVTADSRDIFPSGWCEKFGHILQPPPGYTVDDFNWMNYIKATKSTIAPKHLFVHRAGNTIYPNGFRVGMKLEAVDRKNTSLVCVSSISDMMDNRILVHFDSWDDIYDYWADPTSPYIHPVGWCDQFGHSLTPPNGYPNPETFTWEKYLKETKTAAAPSRAFKQRPLCGFKRGMRLECVDKRVPRLIRVATVDDVRDHQIRISFDGWPDRYSYWVDDDSPDIHPVGWCQKSGHPIEPPLTPDDVYDFLECPTVGCRGQGHTKGARFPTHSSQKHCPYAEENIDQELVLRDRLVSPDRQLEAVVPVSREPREHSKPQIGRPPKIPRLENMKTECQEEEDDKPLKRKRPKNIKQETKEYQHFCLTNCFANTSIEKLWSKHVKYLNQFIRNETNPIKWSELEVGRFVSSFPGCKEYAHVFKMHNFNGQDFLSLTQHELIKNFRMKVGPAVKLYNSILLLRRRCF